MATLFLPSVSTNLFWVSVRAPHHNRCLLPLATSSLPRTLLQPSVGAIRCQKFSNQGKPAGDDAVGVPRSVPVRVAHELLQAGHHYLDVRTVEEFSAGHAVGAVNVPYMFKIGTGMSKNPNFLEEVSSLFGKDNEIIVGCQSGKRSLMAATDLSSAGFTGVTDIAGGYSAWKQNELPTE
eukprot:TRINITY_DN6855_c0_g2_i1.p1 TRINITY_DN6855_c0_g2~~TRINITY_DN6855_c0_g2_i1.p1  ORF type:complete len:179 (+),score=29.94 TRINITY_DN6855_c0_g2_i1:502-1038(+)